MVVDFYNLNNDFVANSNYIFNLFGALNIKLGNVNKAFLAGCNFNKCAEGHKACNLTTIDRTNFRVVSNGFNYHKSTLCIFAVNSSNKYLTIIVDINFTFTVCLNLLNNLTTGTNNFTNLVGVNGGGKHFGCILGNFCTGFSNSLKHNFVKDVVSCLVCFSKSFLNDFRCKTMNL